MKKLLRILAVAVLGVSLSTGIAAAQSDISNTGQKSTNVILHDNDTRVRVRNNTQAGVVNNNPQNAHTGNASADKNTTGGNVGTGAATNSSSLSATASVSYDSSSAMSLVGVGSGDHDASIDQTGQNSSNKITFDNDTSVRVNNTTTLSVVNNNSQTATSGNASADKNTTVGDVQTGDASNTSEVVVDFTVNN